MSRIFNPSLSWKDGDLAFSQGFDDIYFKADGLSETRVVFLGGNNLPQAWQDEKQFTICETGFGTGLNFLATWKMFEETSHNNERLDFISVEQYPMHKDDLRRSLKHLAHDIGQARIERLLKVYPMRIPGFHRIWISDRITLTLIFDDALRGFRQLDCPVDAWFLDGFSPSKNETMWQDDLFIEMARLSHSKTTLASFTAVAKIRHTLEDIGFKIERVKGYGYKKHRIMGQFQTDKIKPVISTPEKIIILGAGLAGSAVAYALKRRGIKVEVFEKEKTLGAGASGNQLGLINPKIEAQDNPRTDVGLSAFSFAQHILSDLNDIDYNQSGALHPAFDDDKKQRLEKLYQNGSWLEPHMQWITKDKTQTICGLPLNHDCVFYPDAASVNTKKLVAKLLDRVAIHFEQSHKNPDVIACGWGLHEKFPKLPLQPVRGQVTYVQAPQELKCPVMFGSYVATTQNGLWAIGATFEKNQDDPVIQDSARQKNLASASEFLSLDLLQAEVESEWAQIRTASRDRYPIVGKINDHTYVSGALGSHGIQFSLLLGEIIACQLTGAPLPIGKDALQTISVNRFGSKS